jgi:iron-sulfur cluster insertion protein
MEAVDPAGKSGGISVSEGAARRIRELNGQEEFRGMMLRVAVSGGGCSGFQYGFSFDDTANPDDHVIERDGTRVLIDAVSWDFLVGAEIHFEDGLIGAYFTVKNPNAASTCGCGTSFAIG